MNINKLIKDAIVLDCHNDTMLKATDNKGNLILDIGKDTDLHIDFVKMKKVGLNVAYFSAFTKELGSIEENNSRILSLINALHKTVLRNKNIADISSDISKIRSTIDSGKIAVVPTIEGAYSINEKNYEYLTIQYADLGVKVISYVWNNPNNLGHGAFCECKGLTELGYKYTKLLNDMGIVIDVSHMNEGTFDDVLRTSKAPIIASHSSCRSLIDHVRNLTDSQLFQIKENKGVININYWWKCLNSDLDKSSYIDIVDHIDYVKKIIGINYVGLGSDFDGATMPKDISSCLDIYKIVEELIRRKYSDKEIRKVLGLNNLRVMKEVEANQKIKLDNDVKIQYNKEDLLFELDRDVRDFKIVLDGIIIEKYKRVDNKIFIDKEILDGKFHVLSLEAEKDNKVSRITSIIR